MSINIYKNIELINGIYDTLFNSEEIRDKSFLMVLIFEAGFKNQRIKIGGKLAKMVKNQLTEIKDMIRLHEH